MNKHRLIVSAFAALAFTAIGRADTVHWHDHTWKDTNHNDLKVTGGNNGILSVFVEDEKHEMDKGFKQAFGHPPELLIGGAHYATDASFKTAPTGTVKYEVQDPGKNSGLGYDMFIERSSTNPKFDDQQVHFGAFPGSDKYFVAWEDFDVKKNGKLDPIPHVDVALFGHRTEGTHDFKMVRHQNGSVTFAVDGHTYFTEGKTDFINDFYFGDVTLEAFALEHRKGCEEPYVNFSHYAAHATPLPPAAVGGAGLIGMIAVRRLRRREVIG